MVATNRFKLSLLHQGHKVKNASQKPGEGTFYALEVLVQDLFPKMWLEEK